MTHIDRSPWPPVIKCASPLCRQTVPVRGMFCFDCRLAQAKTIRYLRAKKAQKDKHA